MREGPVLAFARASKSFGAQSSPLSRVRDALRSALPADARQVLRDINFEVAPGEAVGVIGANGAGKSTLLALAAGALEPTTGTVAVDGQVAALLELGGSFVPELTGRENIRFLHEVVQGRGALAPGDEAAILAFADIGDHVDHPVRTYSSGTALRLAFACATAEQPDLLLVDEVLAVGDVHFQQRCYHRIAELRANGTSLLLVTHLMLSLAGVCDRVLVLEAGEVVFDGPAAPALDRYFLGRRSSASAGTRHGAGGARIESPTVVAGEARGQVVLSCEVVADRAVEAPHVGLRCTTPEGVPLHSTSTLHHDLGLGPMAPGDRRRVTVSLDLAGCAGDLLVDLSAFDEGPAGIVVLDHRVGVLQLQARPDPRWVGLVDLRSAFRVDS